MRLVNAILDLFLSLTFLCTVNCCLKLIICLSVFAAHREDIKGAIAFTGNARQHLLLTDHNVCLLDDRFANTVVSQWSHATCITCNVLPAMFKSTRIGGNESDNSHLITIAADKSITLMTLNEPSNCELIQPRSLHLPLMASFVSDSYDLYVASEADACGLVEDRCVKSTIRGLAPVVTDFGFSLFVLSNFNDIFVQDFFETTAENQLEIVDHSWTSVCGGEHLTLSDDSVELMRQTMRELDALGDQRGGRSNLIEEEDLLEGDTVCCGAWRTTNDHVGTSGAATQPAAARSEALAICATNDSDSSSDDVRSENDDAAGAARWAPPRAKDVFKKVMLAKQQVKSENDRRQQEQQQQRQSKNTALAVKRLPPSEPDVTQQQRLWSDFSYELLSAWSLVDTNERTERNEEEAADDAS